MGVLLVKECPLLFAFEKGLHHSLDTFSQERYLINWVQTLQHSKSPYKNDLVFSHHGTKSWQIAANFPTHEEIY